MTKTPLPPPPAPIASSGLVIYSDIDGDHLPVRFPRPKAGEHVIVSFVACERRSQNDGPARWSCRPDDSDLAPDERLVLDRATACFRVERRTASPAVVAGLSADSQAVPPAKDPQLVFLRLTQINRSKEVTPIGCEGAGGHACDPVGAKSTGRTIETVIHSHTVYLAVQGALTTTQWLERWPFPPWRAPVSYAKLDGDPSFAPGETFSDADARTWLERLSKIDDTEMPRATRLALSWNRAILAFKLRDPVRGREALAAAEQALAPPAERLPIDQQIAREAPALHALAEGTLSLDDPCRRR